MLYSFTPARRQIASASSSSAVKYPSTEYFGSGASGSMGPETYSRSAAFSAIAFASSRLGMEWHQFERSTLGAVRLAWIHGKSNAALFEVTDLAFKLDDASLQRVVLAIWAAVIADPVVTTVV